jgi:hypothetical protein
MNFPDFDRVSPAMRELLQYLLSIHRFAETLPLPKGIVFCGVKLRGNSPAANARLRAMKAIGRRDEPRLPDRHRPRPRRLR